MRCLVLLLVLTSFCFADLKYRIQTTGRQVGDTDRIVYVHGQRIRTDALKSGRISMRECDLNRIVRLDPATKTYRIVSISGKPDVLSTRPSPNSGWQVCRGTPRRQVEELGSGTMLGVPVQHMKVWIYSDPVPESCVDPNRHSFLAAVRDGWYVAVPDVPECPARTEADRLGLENFDEPDRYTPTDGSTTSELLPMYVQVQVPRGQQLETIYTLQVTEFSTEALDPKLFDIPPDYQPAPAPDCSKTGAIVGNLEDRTPVYSFETANCGIIGPRVTYQPAAEYSERARKKQITGTVTLSLIVDRTGKVRDVKVEHSVEPTLDQAAMSAVSTWKFEPAMKDGQPVAVRVKVDVSFSLYPRH